LFRRYVDEVWRIPTDHFDPLLARRAAAGRIRPIALEAVLVRGSNYCRRSLKRRLYQSGLKARSCELCGQGEDWLGAHMSLILDHINGVPDDNRIENLRIVCPNCAATLDTHCGRKNKLPERECARCGEVFAPRSAVHRYCSRHCGIRHDERRRGPRLETRKVDRPSYEQLMADVESMGFVATGRKYGVSDNAVRKWIRWYEHEAERNGHHGEDNAPPEQEAA
jgi:Zn ribbon nucleic-acid-binding protein